MKLDMKRTDHTLVVALEEARLDAAVAEDFKKTMHEQIDSGVSSIVLNLKQVDFIDSTGMTAIVSVLKKISLAGGNLAVCEIGPRLANLFHLTKLDRVFNLCPTEEDALDKVKK